MNNLPNKPMPEEIAQYAYLIWEREGRPHGRDMAHWIEAEEQLLAARQADIAAQVKAPARPSRLVKTKARAREIPQTPEPTPATA